MVKWNRVLLPSQPQDAPASLHTSPSSSWQQTPFQTYNWKPQLQLTGALDQKDLQQSCWPSSQWWGIKRSSRCLICALRYQALHTPAPSCAQGRSSHSPSCWNGSCFRVEKLQHWRRKPHQTHSSASRSAGRGLFSTACSRIHVPTWMPELEKIKHSYAYPSILNASSFPDYMFQMKATEGRKT